jgi:hypothetical protein
MILLALLACPGTKEELVYVDRIVDTAATAADETGTADAGDTAEADPDEPATPSASLPAPRLLRRMSLDLRGVLPSTEELDAVEADPEALWTLRDAYLADPLLEERLVLLLSERWHTRIDDFLVDVSEYQAFSEDPHIEYAVERAIGEEPLRLIARIAVEDRPWSEVVTADHTMANEYLAEVWPLELADGTGWREATYTDGRPSAGVLSTNGLWWRYFSTQSNMNRGRVAALTRLLICVDYASRTITFAEDETLASAGDLESALRSSPYCMGCHSAIDPIAASLMGFWPANTYQVDEIDTYHPEREVLAASVLGVAPSWYGTPIYGLNELGVHIAADPRFLPCAAKTFASLLWRRETSLDDYGQLQALTQHFEANGARVRSLLSAITETASYQTAGHETQAGLRLLTPNQLESAIEALTGYRWTFAGYNQMDNDTIGYRNLAGGVDGNSITRAQDTPSLTWALTVQRLSEAAAALAVSEDLNTDDGPNLLDRVEPTTTPDDAAFTDQISALHWRMYGQRADDDWVDAITVLWETVDASEGSQTAWTAVVSAMIRDPAFGSY